MNTKEILQHLKMAYLTPYSLVLNIIISIFYIIPYFTIKKDLDTSIPLYLKVFIFLWILFVILSLIQERRVLKVKNSKMTAIRYLVITILAAFVIPLATSTIYIFAAELQYHEVFDIWLRLALSVIISWFGSHLVLGRAFEVTKLFKLKLFTYIGFIIIIIPFIYLAYIGFIVPAGQDESNKFIWVSLLVLFGAHLFIITPYAYLGEYFKKLKNPTEEGGE
ncbi:MULTISPECIES: DUF5079 family protein [Staphylococcus]|uniref:DUF5079 family protein n=1 Tax=Staphylococcus hsinchuensis TaxID=3051183 RepID=A0ABZ3EF66_9STAP|nr:DUF5079 family protein [Staphylococcus sp. Marseille-Q6910]